MANPKAKQQKREGAAAEEFRRRPASDYIYQFSDHAQGGTHPEVYRILGIPNPEDKTPLTRED